MGSVLITMASSSLEKENRSWSERVERRSSALAEPVRCGAVRGNATNLLASQVPEREDEFESAVHVL